MSENIDNERGQTFTAQKPTPDPTADAAKLLPCPWCATPPLGSPLNNALEPKRSMYLLQCPSGKCPVRPKVYGSDQADAERRWNTRPQPAPPAGEMVLLDPVRKTAMSGAASRPKVEDADAAKLLRMLEEANGVLRSAYQIAKRDGLDTNWSAFKITVENILTIQHEAGIRWNTRPETDPAALKHQRDRT